MVVLTRELPQLEEFHQFRHRANRHRPQPALHLRTLRLADHGSSIVVCFGVGYILGCNIYHVVHQPDQVVTVRLVDFGELERHVAIPKCIPSNF